MMKVARCHKCGRFIRINGVCHVRTFNPTLGWMIALVVAAAPFFWACSVVVSR